MSDISKLYEIESTTNDIVVSDELLEVPNGTEVVASDITNEYEVLLGMAGYNDEIEELTLESDSLINLSKYLLIYVWQKKRYLI